MLDGFAYAAPDGKIDIRTISASTLATKVNAATLMGAQVHQAVTEDQLDEFLDHQAPSGYSIRPVRIRLKTDA